MGWYTLGSMPSERDLAIHRQVMRELMNILASYRVLLSVSATQRVVRVPAAQPFGVIKRHPRISGLYL